MMGKNEGKRERSRRGRAKVREGGKAGGPGRERAHPRYLLPWQQEQALAIKSPKAGN
jgi:hypothetical protein